MANIMSSMTSSYVRVIVLWLLVLTALFVFERYFS
jgi:hypothetical protein